MKPVNHLCSIVMLAAILSLVSACKTTPAIDWAGRVGVFTYDDAVIELGPPDKMTGISSGRVAEWVTGHDRGPSLSFGLGSHGAGGGVGVGTVAGGKMTVKILRLTFDDQDKLVTWENTAR